MDIRMDVWTDEETDVRTKCSIIGLDLGVLNHDEFFRFPQCCS